MKKSLLLVQLDGSGQPVEGNWEELCRYLAISDVDKIVFAGEPSSSLQRMIQGFEEGGTLVDVVEHADASRVASYSDIYEVTHFNEDCCGF